MSEEKSFKKILPWLRGYIGKNNFSFDGNALSEEIDEFRKCVSDLYDGTNYQLAKDLYANGYFLEALRMFVLASLDGKPDQSKYDENKGQADLDYAESVANCCLKIGDCIENLVKDFTFTAPLKRTLLDWMEWLVSFIDKIVHVEDDARDSLKLRCYKKIALSSVLIGECGDASERARKNAIDLVEKSLTSDQIKLLKAFESCYELKAMEFLSIWARLYPRNT